MTSDMRNHTRRLAIRLALVMALFAALSTSLAVLARYREALTTLLAHHQTIHQNLSKMRMETAMIHDTIASFKRLLPNGYQRSSAEKLLYARLEEVKTRLPSGEMTVKPLQTREGLLSLEFSFKPSPPSYSNLVNILGQLEMAILPFVSIQTVTVEDSSKDKPGPLAVAVEGVLLTQAPATDGNEAAMPVAPPPPVPVPGGAH